MLSLKKYILTECQCGCKKLRPKYDSDGKERRFIRYHFSGRLSMKLDVATRTSYDRANKVLKKDRCIINNKDCKGDLQAAHIDQDPSNNNINNLVCLCRTHHNLMDRRGITIRRIKYNKT